MTYINLLYRASTSLRDVCGGHSVQELIENRDAISNELHIIIGPIAKSWGLKVRCLLISEDEIGESYIII
jgi:regulator of protease activity HflC (stomatin/prohibitin superfamily)